MNEPLAPSEADRVLRRLTRADLVLAPLDDRPGVWGAFPGGDRRRRPAARLSAELVSRWRRQGWLEPMSAASETDESEGREAGARLRLSAVGWAAARRAASVDPDERFAEQHRVLEAVSLTDEAGRPRARAIKVNVGDSPLAWLARRTGADGQPLISPRQRAAGERLRRDHEIAARGPKLTMDWSGEPGDGRPRTPAARPPGLERAASAARRRIGAALDAVGPGLDAALRAVCLDDLGLDAAERALKWPQRSARVVLAIALDRLADHYGLPL